MKNTKSIILQQALTLFSEKGYTGISMRDIAGAAGIQAASIYNHYKSKEDIFNSIFDEMTKRYNEMIAKIQIPNGSLHEVTEDFMQISERDLILLTEKLFLYFLKDDFASKFRRMLTIEQFRSAKIGATFQNFFIDGVLNYTAVLFDNMINQNGFIKCDPYIMALHFYSPIFLLLNKYDHLPEKDSEALNILKKHIEQFSNIYKSCNAQQRN